MKTALRTTGLALAAAVAAGIIPAALAEAPQRQDTAEQPAIVLARAKASQSTASRQALTRAAEADPALAAALENIAEENRSELEMRLAVHTSVIMAAGN